MKKVIICLSLLLTTATLGGNLVGAEASTTEQAVSLAPKAYIRCFPFSSKPPKKYKGLNLIKVEKVKNGYFGYYI